MPNSVKSALKCSHRCMIVLEDRLKRRGRDEGKGFWRNVSGQIHGVMENAHDLDDLSRCSAIHDEMSPSSAVACDVEAAEIGKDFVARDARRGGIRAPLRRQ